jgi:hypothetical protein
MVSARSAEKIAAMKEEKLRIGKATCNEFPGGNRGREIKYMTVLLISIGSPIVEAPPKLIEGADWTCLWPSWLIEASNT